MLVYTENNEQDRLRTARRVFGLVPVVVFLLTLMLFTASFEPSPQHFLQLMLRVAVATLASSLVCVAAYGFYRYLVDRSLGL